MSDIKKWCKENFLDVEIRNDVVLVAGIEKGFLYLQPKKGKIIKDNLTFILDETEIKKIFGDLNIGDKVVFSFGERFFYTEFDIQKFDDTGSIPVVFNDFKYLGNRKGETELDFAHLGVHSEYDLLDGVGTSTEWVKKAKFLGHFALGLKDKNTLAGVISHQTECLSAGLKPIIGMTASVRYGKINDVDVIHELIFYALSKAGWRNLLGIHKQINVINDGGYVKNKYFTKENCEGVACVISVNSIFNVEKDIKKHLKIYKLYNGIFGDNLYYQLDSVTFHDDRKSIEYAAGLKRYLKIFSKKIKPILIGDSYYLDPEYHVSRSYLHDIKRMRGALSHEQYYKSVSEHLADLDQTYQLSPRALTIVAESIDNAKQLAQSVDFNIEIGHHKLPEFEMKGSKKKFFYKLLQQGIETKILTNAIKSEKVDEYLDRLEEEANVIVEAGFIDYFLILWDVVKWTKDKGYLVGNGRGSVGGSLLSYLLDITTIDPIEYDLLFERFLNKARISGERAKAADSMPDIDLDFGSSYREEVKKYMEYKYGGDSVVRIGSFTRLKTKGAIKGFARADKMNFEQVNFVTRKIPDKIKEKWDEIFLESQKNSIIKTFVQGNVELINNIKPVFMQALTASIHASALVIVPKKDSDGNSMTVYDWMPVRKIKDEKNDSFVLISEWEGKFIERAGFLKEDILAISLLDKFMSIIKLIKKERGETIILEDIPVDDAEVFKLFRKGYNEDVFQFGTEGIQNFSRMVKPDHIEDLIAMNALFRPGPMASNAHKDYADIKHGRKKPVFDPLMELVTSKTNGLIIYQEQMMQAMVVGGMSLVEADTARTYIKKFNKAKMVEFKDKFISGYGSKLEDQKNFSTKKAFETANDVWDKMMAFSSYAFNRSHSAAYSIMSYWCQWLKLYYPEEFYATALQFSTSENDATNILGEIEKRQLRAKVFPPEINNSNKYFRCSVKDHAIYWSISSIKHVGASSVEKILKVRKEKGEFASIVDFLKKMKGTGVGRGIVDPLIRAGSFDKLYNVEHPKDRYDLMKIAYEFAKDEKIFEERYAANEKNYRWQLWQKELTGFGNIDYQKALLEKGLKKLAKVFVDADTLQNKPRYAECCIAGRVMYVDSFHTKNGKAGKIILESNNQTISAIFWADVWDEISQPLADLRKKYKDSLVVAITGKVGWDKFKDKKMFQSDSETTDIEVL